MMERWDKLLDDWRPDIVESIEQGDFELKRIYEIVIRHADEPEMDSREYKIYKELPLDIRRRFAAILKDSEFISLNYTVGLYSFSIREHE